MNFNDLLSTAASIVLIATLAGLGLLRGTVQNLRENLRDARDEILDKERRIQDKDVELTTVKAERDALQRLKSNTDEITLMVSKLDTIIDSLRRRP